MQGTLFMSLFFYTLMNGPTLGVWGDTSSEGIFTSNLDLQHLLLTQAEVISSLQDYIQEEEQRMQKLKQITMEYKQMLMEAEPDVEEYVGNPLNAYLLIKRLTTDWNEIRSLISYKLGENVINQLVNRTYTSALKWPSEDDLNGAAIALTRLQDTYNLRPGDIANGKLLDKSYNTQLSASDCFELGKQSYNIGDHQHCVQWMEEALKKWKHEIKKSVDEADILDYLAFSWYSLGNMKKAIDFTNQFLQLVPDHARAKRNKEFFEQNLQSEDGVYEQQQKGDDGSDFVPHAALAVGEVFPEAATNNYDSNQEKYRKLCRGQSELSVKANLKCFFQMGHVTKMVPFKVEELHSKPRILKYHEVISDEEIEVIKDLASPRFKRATIQNYMTGVLETASYRISKTAWLSRDESPTIDRIYKRVADATGLSMDTSEDLQVSNYGIGGHYEPHFDFARSEEKHAFESLGTGNRIATWLFYESDVDLGGATVFLHLGLTLRPEKGSAVFWYNLHKNGEGDELTRHAACPVLAGTKWVSNFWIHERGQEFIRPCDKNPFI